MDTQLVRFTQWAQQKPQARYNALMGLLSTPDGLMHSFEVQPGNKARGIDQVGKSDYAQDVDARIKALSSKLRSLSYPATAPALLYLPPSMAVAPATGSARLHPQEQRAAAATGHSLF